MRAGNEGWERGLGFRPENEDEGKERKLQCVAQVHGTTSTLSIVVISRVVMVSHPGGPAEGPLGYDHAGEEQLCRLELDAVAGHQCREHGDGVQEVCEGHSRARQGDEGVGYLHGAGLHSEEHGDLAEGRGRASEPGYSRPALGTDHAGHTGT